MNNKEILKGKQHQNQLLYQIKGKEYIRKKSKALFLKKELLNCGKNSIKKKLMKKKSNW